tara:strand:- start:1364 stop:2395 length:1032 start_codon:yes stop_codon:yes gene_type:complete
MNIIDLFSGVGGLGLGFEQAGFKNICSIDNWHDAIKTHNFNRKEINGYVEDIGSFKNEHLTSLLSKYKIDGVLGGPPCQGFSSARLSDTTEENQKLNKLRNKLVFEFIDVVKKVDPFFFVMENVRGMLSINKGEFLRDIVGSFARMGFRVNFELIDLSEYQIPQSRKRLFIVGMKNSFFNFPLKFVEKISSYQAISDLPEHTSSTYTKPFNNTYQQSMRKNCKILHNHETTNHSIQTIEIISKVPNGGSIKNLSEEYWNIRKFNKAFQRMDKNLPSLTIDTGHRNYFHYELNRIPTVRENARLQSFSDDFKFLGSKTSQYKQVGNAVPPKFSHELAIQIKNQY